MMMQQFGIEVLFIFKQNTVRIPLLSEISKYSDNGTPIAFVLPTEHFLAKIYTTLCAGIAKELSKENERVFVFYNTAERKVVVEERGKKKFINPYALRLACKCAVCIDELSGAMLIKREEVDPQVYPTKIEDKGNYAVAVVWSDGHRSSIYPYKRLTSNEVPSA